MEKILIKLNGRNLSVNVKRLSFFGRFIGLMFKSSKTENLLFDFGKDVDISIHSFFVFFPFWAIWVDSKNRVIEKKLVSPWIFSVKPKKSFRKLIETPLNDKNKDILRLFKR
jgi:uncharacterized membrane protein (UPF0127 family)